MKKNISLQPILFWMVLSCLCSVSAQTRVSSFGSNPDFSWTLFPQDISLQHSNALIFFPSYCKSPWWGDIDEVNNKPPKAVYTITGSEVSESSAHFEESAKMHTSKNTFGYSYRPSGSFTTKLEFDYTLNALRDRAEGNFTNNTNNSFIPFDYSLRHTLNNLHLRGLFGFSIRDIPVGLNLSVEMENTLALKHDFTFTKNDTIKVSTDRTLWGWSTVGCNHIFGIRGTEGDAWLQNSYSTGPLYSLNLITGATLDKAKIGLSLSYRFGRQDFFSWESDTTKTTGDTIVDRNFLGEYVKNDWTKKSHAGQINVYGNIHWITGDFFGVHSFLRVGYRGSQTGRALADNLEVESDSKEAQRGFLIEVDPNINIKLGPSMHYIDIGLLLQYEYYRSNNTFMRWVGGGRTKTYWDSRIYELDETSWENFSYANQNIFDAGADLSAMFPLFNNIYGQLGFGLIMFGNVKCNFQTKYYGTNSDNGSENEFTVNNRRENYTREVLFSTTLMLNYVKNRYNVRFEVNEPLLHSLTTRTRIADAKGNNSGPYHKKDPLWLSLQGLEVGFFVSYDFQFPFLNYK